MENKFSKGIEEIKKIGLTPTEKSAVLSRIFEKTPIQKPIKSPWFQNILIGRHLQPVLAFTLIFILGGGGLALGSNKALPGDILYSLKVGAVEPLVGSFMLLGEAKANWQVSLATKRLTEAGSLAAEGRLDEPKQREIESLIEKYTLTLKADLKIIEARDSQSNSFKSENEDKVVAKQAESAPTLMMSAAKIEVKTSKKNSKTESIRRDFESKMNSGANFLEIIGNEKNGTTSKEVFNLSKKARESGKKLNKDEDDNNENDEGIDYKEEFRILNLEGSSKSDDRQKEFVKERESNESLPASVGAAEVKVEIKTEDQKGEDDKNESSILPRLEKIKNRPFGDD